MLGLASASSLSAQTLTPGTFSTLQVGNTSADGTIVAQGKHGTSPILATTLQGAGSRMLWYPRKSAFRAGAVSGTQWDDSQVGNYSAAMGWNTIAKGTSSWASGATTSATGANSTALGRLTKATGISSTAMGDTTQATGNYSTSLGVSTLANSYASTVLGAYNKTLSRSATTWVATEPLFEVGNGTAALPSNALTLYKNGNMELQGSLSTGGAFFAPTITTTGAIQAGSIAANNITSGGKNVVTANYDGSVSLVRGIQSNYFAGVLDGAHNFSLGPATVASAGGAMAIGFNTKAEGQGSFASGWHSRAIGSSSVAFGHGSEAHGYESLVMGGSTKAYGNHCFSGGWASTSSNYNSFTYGHHCHANSFSPGGGYDGDSFAIAMGSWSSANASYSLALGYGANAEASLSTAIGRSLRARTLYEHNIGVYAKVSTLNNSWAEGDALFRLGNGYNEEETSDAITVLKNGQTSLINKAWSRRSAETSHTADPSAAEDDAAGNALVVEGHSVMRGNTTVEGNTSLTGTTTLTGATTLSGTVTLSQVQGDIAMGIFE